MSETGLTLYSARVMHRRHVAPLYRFVYRVFYLLIDIDRIDETFAPLRLLSRNRFNVLAFHDRDHGEGRTGGLRQWAEDTLEENGVSVPRGRIRLLCMPRVLGYGFNPISIWYCEDPSGLLRAVIAEVNNTFGEKHSYVLASSGDPIAYDSPMDKDKCFHVSPFFDLTGQYQFLLSNPAERFRVVIKQTRDGKPSLDATLTGEGRTPTDPALIRQVLTMPLMTLKVVFGIHWEALKIWLRGGKFHSKPAPPTARSS